MEPTDGELAAWLADWLPHQRWFAGRTVPVTAVRISRRTALGDDAWHLCVAVDHANGRSEVYQVPVVLTDEPVAPIAAFGDRHVDDGLHHRPVVAALLGSTEDAGGLRSHWLGEPQVCDTFEVLQTEQSNTSIVCGALLVKFLRRLHPGVNPEIEILAALTELGSPEIVALRGWLDGTWQDGDTSVHGCMALYSDFLPDAQDGGRLAVAAVSADRSFAVEAEALGRAVARLHQDLADAFGTTPAQQSTRHLHERLDVAAAHVPEVANIAADLHRQLDAAQTEGSLQRIHGDLHLGQTLRSADDWRIIDFEGEPASSQDSRRAPDHPLRDVAGMIRSFDYGARMFGNRMAWRDEATAAFLSGYVAAGGFDPQRAPGLLNAYLIDKAAYEAMYERQHRPDWAWIPLAALAEMGRED